MRLADLVAGIHRDIDPVAAMADVAEICRHDRYQASAGIVAAAEFVAGRAEAAGLSDVEVMSFPADGALRWWSFQAPLSWTPVRARLLLGATTVIDYPDQPYTLAAYSASTALGGVTAPLLRWSKVWAGADPAGALVVVDGGAAPGSLVARLSAAGAVGFAADVLAHRRDRWPGQVGRIELPAGGPLCAFSLTDAGLAMLLAGADDGTPATVEVELDPAVTAMPVVTGVLPGRRDDQILLTAHLCHPRPSANDNASGVAALLAAARVLARHGARPDQRAPSVRFLWGPEFVGTAAYLHDVAHAGAAPVPALALNIDMAGENVARCGGPLVIERGPDELPSYLTALACRSADLLPAAARSYSGAVPADAWSWRSAPFAGGSDHAMLAGAPTSCPTVCFGHWPDSTNHTSVDTVETVDPAELRRTAAVAAATVAALRGVADPQLCADLVDATAGWAGAHVLDALPGRRPPVPVPDAGMVLDPHGDAAARRRLTHRGGVAVASVRALGGAGVPAEQVRPATAWVESVVDAILAPGTGPDGPDQSGMLRRSAPRRCWSGPVNLRALAHAVPDKDRAWLDEHLARDRGGTYARCLALLRGVDGQRDRMEVAWWAAMASELAIPLAFAEEFLDLASRAGWLADTGTGEE